MNTETNQTTVTNTTEISIKENTMNTNALTQSIDTMFGTEEEMTMNQNIMNMLDSFSHLYSPTLTDKTIKSFDETLKEKLDEQTRLRNSRIRRLGGFVHVVHIIKDLISINDNSIFGPEGVVTKQLIQLAAQAAYRWKYTVKGMNMSHYTRNERDLIEMFGKGSQQLKGYREAYEFIKPYLTDEVIQYESGSNIKMELKYSGVKISIKGSKQEPTILTPVFGQPFHFDRNVSMVLTHHTLNSLLPTVLKTIRIHNVYETTDASGRKGKEFTKKAYQFEDKDALLKVLLMKHNNIDITELYEAAKNGVKKMLIIKRDEQWTYRSLSRLEVPTHSFFKVYGRYSVASTKDAKNGLITELKSIPRLIEFNKVLSEVTGEEEIIVSARELVNKSLSRLDKLNNSKALWTFDVPLFVVIDATVHPLLNQALVGGNILLPNDVVYHEGMTRVVTDMDNGGVKSTTMAYAQTVDNIFADMENANYATIAASGFKGGLLSAVGMATNWSASFMQNLNTLIAGCGKEQEIISAIYSLAEALTTVKVIGGKEVRGIMLPSVTLKVTNAYSVTDMLEVVDKDVDLNSPQEEAKVVAKFLETLTQELETGKKGSNGLVAYVVKQKQTNPLFSVGDWINEGVENGTLRHKPQVTRVISQELQSIAHWYGDHVAKRCLDNLLSLQNESGIDISKVYAAEYLGALERNIVGEVSVTDIADVLKASDFKSERDSAVYPTELALEVLELIGITTDDLKGWLRVTYPNGESVDVPVGYIFTSDLFEQINDNKTMVITKGLFNSLLEHVKQIMNEQGTILLNTLGVKHLYLDAEVQRSLLGKAFGYQTTKGFYGAILPMVGNFGVTCAGITHRNRIKVSEDTWLQLTLSKAPQYFKGSTGSYYVMDLKFGRLNRLSRCAVFVNPEIALMFQNDFDGDLMRVSENLDLPFVDELYKEFNGTWFKSFVDGEFQGNKLSVKPATKCSLEQYHEAIYNAVKAKDNVGLYTANSYFYEGVLPNIVNEVFCGTDGETYMINEDDAYKITALLKMLIQVEAMNNMKQEDGRKDSNGNNTAVFITDQVLAWKLGNTRSYDPNKSDEQVVHEKVQYIAKLIEGLATKHEIELTPKSIITYVQAMYYAASNFKVKDLVAMNVFNARAVSEKNINAITAFVTGQAEDLNTSFNFKDSYESIVNGVDTKSMAYHIITTTVDNILAAFG